MDSPPAGPASTNTSLRVAPLDADLMLVISARFLEQMERAPNVSVSGQARRWLLNIATYVVPVPEYDDWGDVLDLMERHATRWRA